MDEEPVQIRRRESSVRPDSNGSLLPNGYNLSALIEEELQDETVLAVNCRVCQKEIILADEEGFVVKCPACNEATVSGLNFDPLQCPKRVLDPSNLSRNIHQLI